MPSLVLIVFEKTAQCDNYKRENKQCQFENGTNSNYRQEYEHILLLCVQSKQTLRTYNAI